MSDLGLDLLHVEGSMDELEVLEERMRADQAFDVERIVGTMTSSLSCRGEVSRSIRTFLRSSRRASNVVGSTAFDAVASSRSSSMLKSPQLVRVADEQLVADLQVVLHHVQRQELFSLSGKTM